MKTENDRFFFDRTTERPKLLTSHPAMRPTTVHPTPMTALTQSIGAFWAHYATAKQLCGVAWSAALQLMGAGAELLDAGAEICRSSQVRCLCCHSTDHEDRKPFNTQLSQPCSWQPEIVQT